MGILGRARKINLVFGKMHFKETRQKLFTFFKRNAALEGGAVLNIERGESLAMQLQLLMSKKRNFFQLWNLKQMDSFIRQ